MFLSSAYDLKVSVPFMAEPAAELVLVAEGAMMMDVRWRVRVWI